MLVPKFGGMVSRIYAKSDAIGSLPHVVKNRSPERAGAVLPCSLSPWHRRHDELNDVLPRSACAVVYTPCQIRGSVFCARKEMAQTSTSATPRTVRISSEYRPKDHIECPAGRTVRNTVTPDDTRPP